MRSVFLGLFALLAYTTAMVYQPEEQGYTRGERAAMARLVGRVTAQHRGRWPAAEQRAAMGELWGNE